MRNIEEYPEIKVGGHNVNNLSYTDDIVLPAENKLSDIVEEESRKELNRKKAEVMVISLNNECQQSNIFINRTKFKGLISNTWVI